MKANRIFLPFITVALLSLLACKSEPIKSTSVEKSVKAPASQPVKKAAQAIRVRRIAFIGQKNACDCTRNRIDKTWQALQSVLNNGPNIPVERIQRDIEEKKAEKYTKLKPLMVAPGIYFLGKDDNLIELLQGEVTELQIGSILQ